jgi:phage tail sheath gpL-like
LLVAIKLSDRDSSYIEDALRGSMSDYASAATQSITRDKRRIAKGIADLLTGLAGGTMQGDLWVAVPGTDSVLRTKTISCTQATSADEAVTFACGGVSIVLTEGVDFEAGASDTTEAAALVVAINAHAELGRIFSATSAIGVVTVTAKFPGQIMDDWVLTGGTGLVVATTPGGVVVLGDYGTARIALRNVAQGRTP